MKLRSPLNRILNINIARYVAHKAFSDEFGFMFGKFTTMPYPKIKVYKSMRQIEKDFKPSNRVIIGPSAHKIIIDDVKTGDSCIMR